MRKKEILGHFLKRPGFFSTNSIKKLAGESEAYSALLTFLPGSKELRAELDGRDICLAGPGYKWLMYLPLDELWCLTAFYDPENRLFEWYFDISRGNFIDETGIPCTDDIFLDLVVLPDGQKITLDADELREAFDKGQISREDYDLAYRVHDELIDSRWSDAEFLSQFSEKLLRDYD